jgi:hypothetical protein
MPGAARPAAAVTARACAGWATDMNFPCLFVLLVMALAAVGHGQVQNSTSSLSENVIEHQYSRRVVRNNLKMSRFSLGPHFKPWNPVAEPFHARSVCSTQ